MAIDRAKFFAHVRPAPFKGQLTQGQVDGLNVILDEWERRKLTDLRWLAYMLATTYHETAHTMQPIAEYGRGKGRKYGIPDPETGQTYYGRGFVQLTWLSNYRVMGKLLGVDLVNQPDRAMEAPIATGIMFEGMIKGLFTGKKLADYFGATANDAINARRIINGTDKASLIAGYHRQFLAALMEAQTAAQPNPPVAVPPPKAPEQPAEKNAPTGKLEPKGQDAAAVGIFAALAGAIYTTWEWLVAHPVIAISAAAALIGAGIAGWRWWRAHRIRKAGLAAVDEEFAKPEPVTEAPATDADALAAAIANKARGAVACQEAVTTAMAKPVRRKARKKPKKPAKRRANKKRKAS